MCVCVACLRVSNKTRPASAAVFHTAVEKAKTHKTKKHEFCADTDMAARRTTAAVGLLPQKTRGPHKKTSPPAENNRPKSRRALPQGLGACCALSGVSGNTMWWRRALRGVGVFWGRMGERANFRRKESGFLWISKSTREVDGEGFLILDREDRSQRPFGSAPLRRSPVVFDPTAASRWVYCRAHLAEGESTKIMCGFI